MNLSSPIQSVSNMRAKAISGIGTPLGFLVLALLIVEAFIISAGFLFELPMWARISALSVGVMLFVGVVSAVIYLVIKYPQNLVFSESSHLQMALYGAKDTPLTVGSVLMQQASELIQSDIEMKQIASLDNGDKGDDNE